MEHLTLTETEFFRLISNPDSRTGLRTAYDEFTQRVIQLCLIPPESGHPVHALSYAETELQYHEALQGRSHESELNLHVHKALAFVRKKMCIRDSECRFNVSHLRVKSGWLTLG